LHVTKRKPDRVTASVGSYVLSPNHKKALIFNPPESWSIIELGAAGAGAAAPGGPAAAAAGAAKGKLKIDAIEVRIDPRVEWAQIFDEAWRINRDYFYDPCVHGLDCPAMKQKYAQFLPHVATRGDLDRTIRSMLTEMSVRHSSVVRG